MASPSLFDTSLATELTSVTPIPAITSGLDSNTSGNSRETPTRKAALPADVSGANADLDRFKADLQAQTAPTFSRDLGNDLASLVKDLNSGNRSAAQADASKVQVDLQTQDASSVGGALSGKRLDTVIGLISDSLSSGSVQGALLDGAEQDLAKVLVHEALISRPERAQELRRRGAAIQDAETRHILCRRPKVRHGASWAVRTSGLGNRRGWLRSIRRPCGQTDCGARSLPVHGEHVDTALSG